VGRRAFPPAAGGRMGLLSWLTNLFRPRPLTRDVSRLEPAPAAPDAVEEVIDTGGGPLREKHRRRALRDPRLLPKPQPSGLLRRKRKKVLTADEARRLFGGTLRAKDRQHPDPRARGEQPGR